MTMQARAQQGFTLIELMIVIAIVGILAAIALPAYQDYTVRSKMSEPLAALAEAKTSIAEFYASEGSWPTTAAQAGINSNPNKPIVASLFYESTNGALITAGIPGGTVPGAGAVHDVGFSLSATTRSDRSIVWVCKQSVVTADVAGTIDPKFLPSNCRN